MLEPCKARLLSTRTVRKRWDRADGDLQEQSRKSFQFTMQHPEWLIILARDESVWLSLSLFSTRHRCPSLHPGSLWFMITDGIGCYSCCYIKHSLAARLLSCRKFKMVVNTEILLQAWRERWTPLQWLVEVKKLAGKDKKDLDSLAGYLNFILIAKSLKPAGKLFIFWQHIVIEVFETIMNPVSFCKLSLLIWHLSCNFSFNNLVVQQGSWCRGSLTLLPLRHFAVFESQYFLNIKLNYIQELDLWWLNFRIPVLRNTTQNPATAVPQST